MTGIFQELDEINKKFNTNIDRLKNSNGIQLAEQHLKKIRYEAERVSDPKERRLLSSMAREWGRFLYEQTKQFYDTSLNSYKEPILPEPYKFLNNFIEQDETIFFGRDTEINEFLKIVKSNRLSLLFGKSGVGKTSFLLAGIIPKFFAQNYLPIYLRCNQNPLTSIKKKLIKLNMLKSKELNEIPENELIKLVIEVLKDTKKILVIVIDQFEEFFITLSSHIRKEFIEVLKTIYIEQNIDVKIILSFREDFFVEFHEISHIIPDIINIRYRLSELSEEKARDSIIKPLNIIGLSMEGGLVNHILSELSVHGKIEPAQLQIVCFRLYSKLKENQKIITWEDLKNSHGVDGILEEYVDFALEDIMSNDREKAKAILKSMVSAKNTRVPLRKSEISKIKYMNQEIGDKEADLLVKELVNRRLIIKKTQEREESDSYELTHEYLIGKIKKWIDDRDYKIKMAKDLLLQEENNWNNYKEVMELYKFKIINSLKKDIEPDGAKLGLLLRNAIQYDIDINYWVEKNFDNPEVLDFLGDALSDKNKEIKRNALISVILIDEKFIDKKEILILLGEIGNPNILAKIVELNCKFNRIDKPSIIKIRSIIEHRIIKNMTFVPNGECLIGFPPQIKIIEELKEKGLYAAWFDNEYPLHTINVKDFLMDKYLVTNEEYQEFEPNHTFPEGQERHPATNISWFKAKAYAEWIGKDLPTEEEWEKAARGTDKRLFPWGNEFETTKCNTRLSGITGTTPVDEYPEGVSPYGCYDMAGNVWEWTNSWREKDETIIVRGGSWSQQGILPWCAYKYDYNAKEGMQNVGFRCIRRIDNLYNSDKIYSSGGIILKKMNDEMMIILGNTGHSLEWRIPKGTLEKNESIEGCAMREVKEETGYSTKIIEYIDFTNWSYEKDSKIYNETAFFYMMELENEIQEKIGDEFSKVDWFEIGDAINILTYSNEKRIATAAFDKYLSKNMVANVNQQKKIFISYSWENKNAADEIDNVFVKMGITLTRDERDVSYKGSFKEFMKKIREHDFVLMVISDSFLKSTNCMYEVLEFIKDENFKDRILPIALQDAKIFSPEDTLDYISFWNEKYENLNKKLKKQKRTQTIEITRELKTYEQISSKIEDFVVTIKDMKLIPLESLKKNNFKEIFDEIEK